MPTTPSPDPNASRQQEIDDARSRVRALQPVEGDLAFRRRSETIVEWTADAGPDDTILDCGSGYGFTLRVLLALTPANIVGLEYQAERVAETRAALGEHSRLTLVQGDAMALPFADESFSHVVCSEVLEHLPDDRAAVRELWRVLKPGGTMIATVPCASFPFGWDPPNWILQRIGSIQLRGERPWSGIWYGHQRLYEKTDLVHLAEEHGFTVEEVRGLSHTVPPFAHLVMYGIGKPLIQRGWVPQTLRKQADRRIEDAPKPGGPIAAAMRILETIDAPNDAPDIDQRKETFVSIAIRARKPHMVGDTHG